MENLIKSIGVVRFKEAANVASVAIKLDGLQLKDRLCFAEGVVGLSGLGINNLTKIFTFVWDCNGEVII